MKLNKQTTTKQPKQIDKQQIYERFSESSQEYVSHEDELLAYYNLTADQRKQSSWLNEGWEA